MHTLQHQMPTPINPRNALLRGAAPSQEHNTSRPLRIHNLNNLLRELLPTLIRMTVCLVRSHGQARIQQQHTVIRPRRQQTAVLRGRAELGIVFLEGFVDVLEGWWSGRGRSDGEAETVGLVYVVVGVLAEDYGFDSGEGCMAGPMSLG